MGEIIKFPTIQKSTSLDTSSKDTSHAPGTKVLDFKKRADFVIEDRTVKACLFEGFPSVIVGGEIIVHVYGKRQKGIVSDILQRDENNNVTKIAYIIPFLSGDDPLKFGEADFTYDIQTYD